MPRSYPRRILCDCLDCQALDEEMCAARPAWKAAALQDPPPKCLMLFLDLQDGHTESKDPIVKFPHLDAVARDGRSGHLALRADAGSHSVMKLGALAQLLGVYKEYATISTGAAQPGRAWPSLSERFRGLAAGVISDCEQAVQVAKQARCSSSRLLKTIFNAQLDQQPVPLPSARSFAMACMEDLGLRRCVPSTASLGPNLTSLKVDEDDDLDLLLIHLTDRSGCRESDKQQCSRATVPSPPTERSREVLLSWVDAVCKELDNMSDLSESLLLVVLMTAEHEPQSNPFQIDRGSPVSGVQRPRQSFEFAGLEEVSIRQHASVMFAQRLNGVIRRDSSTGFSSEQCRQGAGGGILLERLLPEIAYKLGRAHKYGA